MQNLHDEENLRLYFDDIAESTPSAENAKWNWLNRLKTGMTEHAMK